MESEKDEWKNKYEQKRIALKEVESSLTRQNHDLEMKVANLTSLNERLEEEKK